MYHDIANARCHNDINAGTESSYRLKNINCDLVGKYIAYAALVVLIIFFGVLSPRLFLTAGNLGTILQNSAVQCVVAIGMTFVILIGSIDLSVGSTMALSGLLAAMAWTYIGGGAFFLTPFIGAADWSD